MSESYDDPIEYIRDLLEDDGIVISREIIDLVIGYYKDFRFNMLMNGISIKEKGLYEIRPGFRRFYNMWTRRFEPSLRLKLTMDENLSTALMSRFVNSSDVREGITSRCSDEDLEIMREKLEKRTSGE